MGKKGSSGTLTSAEVTAFTQRLLATLAAADADRRMLRSLRELAAGFGASKGGGGQKPATVEKVKGAIRGKGRTTAATAQAHDQRILDEVRAKKDGIAVGALIESLRMNRKALTRALKRLRDAGAVKMEGEKRLARYRVV